MKKNLLKIPKAVQAKLQTLPERDIVAGCAQKLTVEQIRSGMLAHLGIELHDDGLHYPQSILPAASQGKYSSRNIHGHEVIRKDLPLETHYNSIESPNWGDSYNGTHTVNLPYRAYPRDFYPPRELEIVLHCPNTNAAQPEFIISARVEEVLSQASPNFQQQLLEGLNLLQENFGTCGVEPAESLVAEYARTLHLSWDIFPPGARDEVIQRLFRDRRPTREQQDTATLRYDYFLSLDPRQIIVGTSGFRRYFGALLEDDLVVFENIQYGNAIYVMYDNWQELSSLSRIDLMSGRLGGDFDRVVHRNGWQREVRRLVEEGRQA